MSWRFRLAWMFAAVGLAILCSACNKDAGGGPGNDPATSMSLTSGTYNFQDSSGNTWDGGFARNSGDPYVYEYSYNNGPDQQFIWDGSTLQESASGVYAFDNGNVLGLGSSAGTFAIVASGAGYTIQDLASGLFVNSPFAPSPPNMLALSSTPTIWTAQLVSGSGGGSTCSVPPGAQAAGFTQLIYCADFGSEAYATQESPGSLNLSTGWLGCEGDNRPHEWYQNNTFSPIAPSCSDFVAGATDPATGAQALKMHWRASNCPNGCDSQSNAAALLMQSIYSPGGNCGGNRCSWAFTMPSNYYLEYQLRVSQAPLGTPQAYDTVGGAAYVIDTSGNDLGFVETDPILWEADGSSDGFVANFSVAGNCFSGTYCTDTWDRNQSTLDLAGAVHTAGVLVRHDGSGNGTACGYLDNVLQSCVNTYPTDDEANFDRGMMAMSVGNLPIDYDLYFYHAAVFTRGDCSDPANTECLGSVSP